MQNSSPLKLVPSDLDGRSPEEWLAAQSENIRLVTYVENGVLYQKPVVESGAYVDPTARLMGGIIIRTGCYVGAYAVIRLDEKPTPEPLVMGKNSNLQDCAVIHSTTQQIGERVIIAHQSIVHGAVVEDNVSIYIQATVDGGGTVIGAGSFLHQGSYVGKGIRIAPNRYIAPGLKITTQAQADALPEVPAEVRGVAEHVLELNAAHAQRYLS